MARIRSLHPGQWTDDDFVSCSAFARLLALGLRNEADDNGIFEWNPTKLKMRILPADNADVPALLSELECSRQVLRYKAMGKEYGIIRSFTRFQRPKKPTFQYPVPSEPLPNGYELSKAYSSTSSELVPNQSGNRDADGEKEEEKKTISSSSSVQGAPRATAQPPTARASAWEFPKPDDERVAALHALCLANGVQVRILQAQQWVADGVSEVQMRAAIDRGKQRKPGQSLNAGFLALMLQDVRSEPAAYDAEAVAAEAIALIAKREAEREAEHVAH